MIQKSILIGSILLMVGVVFIHVLRAEEIDPVGEAIHALGLRGCVVLYDSDVNTTHIFGDNYSETEFTPASTFKVAHTLIALETGVVTEETVFKWDGVDRGWDQWNRDLSIYDALHYSAIHIYQQIAPLIGEQRMTEWMKKIEYGNQNIAGGIDIFWVEGELRTTPLQQIDFLKRMVEGKLPVAEKHVEIVKNAMLNTKGEGWTAFAKTGRAIRVLPQVGWYVGWIEREDAKPIYFATVLTDEKEGKRIKRPRLDFTELALLEAGLWIEGIELPYY
ncbi:class D beta-lactamase [bacterium]|nr:class D beta-lactamase [bacterium]